MIHVYLDWNVFDKIEKKSEPVFPEIEKLIKDQIIITPYSNAHINDLVRGYEKNQSYIGGHLSTLSCLTNNLCIVQYWGHKNTTWHYRDVVEFFNSSLDDIQTSSKSFSELLNWDETGLWELHLSMLRLQKLPEEFKQMFKENPIFNLMFPTSKVQMNMLALCEDLYDFTNNAKKDYPFTSLYEAMLIKVVKNLSNSRKCIENR